MTEDQAIDLVVSLIDIMSPYVEITATQEEIMTVMDDMLDLILEQTQ